MHIAMVSFNHYQSLTEFIQTISLQQSYSKLASSVNGADAV